jgi:glycosyltransferase involved in cell wall biosynthesis
MIDKTTPRVAIVTEWLANYNGAERVLEQMLLCFANADVYALVDFLPPHERAFLGGRTPNTSFIQRLPFARKKFRGYLPLMPIAVEQWDMSGYDLVISSSFAVANGVICGPNQLHVSYTHTPIRYAWDLQHQYLSQAQLTRGAKGLAARGLLHWLRQWDQSAAGRPDVLLANSKYIARRMLKTYRREAQVIYPPVYVEDFPLRVKKDDFYLTASRMVPYKRIDLIVDAFAKMPDRKLVVIGQGPDFKKIAAKAGPNVQMMGYQPVNVLLDHMQRAKAFVFAAEEDFGITPVEAQACGTPILAFGRGGAMETVVDGETGYFFSEQTIDCLIETIEAFEASQRGFDPRVIREHARQFRPERFREEFTAVITRKWNAFRDEIDAPGPRPGRPNGRPMHATA